MPTDKPVKKKLAPTGEILSLPECDRTNPGDLAAWYGNFGYDEKFRKVRLANARELVRARAALMDATVSETRIDDLARQEKTYLDYLAANLQGRQIYESELRASRNGI
jgi:hypothetical protein